MTGRNLQAMRLRRGSRATRRPAWLGLLPALLNPDPAVGARG